MGNIVEQLTDSEVKQKMQQIFSIEHKNDFNARYSCDVEHQVPSHLLRDQSCLMPSI